MNAKKIFIIAAVVLLLMIIALVAYNALLKNPGPTATQSPSPPAIAGQSPAASSQKLKPISQEKALGAAIGENGQTVKYFGQSSGSVWQETFDGQNPQKISSPSFKNILRLIWSPDKEKAIIVYLENGIVNKSYYNWRTNEQAPYSNKLGYTSWSPDSKKIAYQYTNPTDDQSAISTADPNGTNYKNIFKTRLAGIIVVWPSADKISLQSPASGLSQGYLFALDPATGNFSKILSDLFGLNAKWSPPGDKALYSKTDANGKNPGLYLTDAQGQNNKNLNLSGLADKCVWGRDSATVYCALPQQMSADAVWPDDYYKGTVSTRDDFYKIDLAQSTKTKIAGSSNETDYDAQELFLSPKEDYLFFTNKTDGLLYSLKLQ